MKRKSKDRTARSNKHSNPVFGEVSRLRAGDGLTDMSDQTFFRGTTEERRPVEIDPVFLARLLNRAG